ncbi:MAG: nuclear transport factor 2 family protein [Chitinophagaceae bacterium]|nr:MAG: nuclear transport factor 2 family protein [Chitinophagaceae bacterium]
MTTQQIADRLAELCQQGEFQQAQKELYAADVISVEPEDVPGFDRETKGADAVLEKIRKFESNVEESFGNKVSDPIVAGNSFAFTLDMDLKMKGQDRNTMSEICVYEVKDGKVTSERFYW